MVRQNFGARARDFVKKNKDIVAAAIVLLFAVALTAGVLSLQWYSSPQQRLRRAFAQEDLHLAQQICAEELEETPHWVTGEILDRLEALGADYAAGVLEYELVQETLATIAKMQIPGTDQQLTLTWQLVDTVHVSRQAYVQGQSLQARQDYPGAMESYAQVMEADTACYPLAQQKITECQDAYRRRILQEAAALADQELYEDAIANLQSGLEVLPEDAVLLEQIRNYSEADAQKKREDLLAQAAACAEKGDFPGALSLLEGKQDDAVLYDAYNAYVEEYAQHTIAQAALDFEKEGYLAAVEVVDTCLKYLPGHEGLLERKAYYESYAPVYLAEHEISAYTGNKIHRNIHTRDKQENAYTSSFAADKGSVSFQTGGGYARLSGTVSCPYGYEYDKYRIGARIAIYADGILIYASELVQLDSAPQSFSLDITGVQVITITWISEGDNIWDNWGYRATIFDGAFYQHPQ